MGLRTLESIRTSVQRNLGNRGFENAVLDGWINTANYEVAGRLKFDALIKTATRVTVDGIAAYSLPDRLMEVRALVNEKDQTSASSKQRLVRIDLEEYYRKDRTIKGEPKNWARDGDGFYLWPTPESDTDVIVAIYLREPQLLSGAGATTEYDSRWDPTLEMLGTYHGYLSVVDDPTASERADKWLQKAEIYIQSLTRDIREDDTPAAGVTVAWSERDLLDQET